MFIYVKKFSKNYTIIELKRTSSVFISFVIKLFCAATQIIAALSVDNFGVGKYILRSFFSAKIFIFSLSLELAITPPPPDILFTPVSSTALTKFDNSESTIASWYEAAKSDLVTLSSGSKLFKKFVAAVFKPENE